MAARGRATHKCAWGRFLLPFPLWREISLQAGGAAFPLASTDRRNVSARAFFFGKSWPPKKRGRPSRAGNRRVSSSATAAAAAARHRSSTIVRRIRSAAPLRRWIRNQEHSTPRKVIRRDWDGPNASKVSITNEDVNDVFADGEHLAISIATRHRSVTFTCPRRTQAWRSYSPRGT